MLKAALLPIYRLEGKGRRGIHHSPHPEGVERESLPRKGGIWKGGKKRAFAKRRGGSRKRRISSDEGKQLLLIHKEKTYPPSGEEERKGEMGPVALVRRTRDPGKERVLEIKKKAHPAEGEGFRTCTSQKKERPLSSLFKKGEESPFSSKGSPE